jgi:hypothetical protein
MSRQTDLAYLAGLIDGEGTIRVGRFKAPGIRYQVQLLLVNTDVRMIEHAQRVTGLGIVYQSKADRTGAIPANWNPVHRWQVVSRQAAEAIKLVRPYLVVKAELADLVLSMPTRSKGRGPHDAAVLAEQERIYDIVRELNRRGRHIGSSLV